MLTRGSPRSLHLVCGELGEGGREEEEEEELPTTGGRLPRASRGPGGIDE